MCDLRELHTTRLFLFPRNGNSPRTPRLRDNEGVEMNQEQVIEKINVIAFDVTCVSGTISRESGSDATVFTPGAVRYIDPTHLRAFTSARQAANRACRARGVRFLSGWAVPDGSVESLVSELNEVALKVANAKTDLIQNWDTNIQAWVEGHPQVEGYRGRFPTKGHADKQTSASLAVYRIHPTAVKSDADSVQFFNLPIGKAFRAIGSEFVMEFVLVAFGHQNELFIWYGGSNSLSRR